MKITVLGSGDAFCGGGRGNAAYLVEDAHGRLLVDCGPTAPHALRRAGFALPSIEHILVTHLHGDHLAGLPFVLLAGMYEEPLPARLTITGPRLLERQVEAAFAALYPDISGKPRRFTLAYREIEPGTTVDVGGRRVTALRMHHMSGEHTALGYRIESGGRVLAVTGDTGRDAPLADLAAGADLLVCECTMPAPPPGAPPSPVKHLSVADISELRPAWTARRVLLTHLSAESRAEALSAPIPGVEVADDGARSEV